MAGNPTTSDVLKAFLDHDKKDDEVAKGLHKKIDTRFSTLEEKIDAVVEKIGEINLERAVVAERDKAFVDKFDSLTEAVKLLAAQLKNDYATKSYVDEKFKGYRSEKYVWALATGVVMAALMTFLQSNSPF